MAIWYDEVFEDKIRYGLKLKRTLFVGQSPFQKVAVVETEALGKALLIDDLWMAAEGEEKVYHEMIVHPALTTAPSIARVLVIGGGDGGTVREVLSYPEVEAVDMVEIDGMVVDACKAHLPEIGTAWDDPRLNLVIGDGIAWVKDASHGLYDVILVDGSDPVGPAVGLFNRDFYEACAARLKPEGVLVTQAESPKLFFDVHVDLVQVLRQVFGHADPFYQTMMIYAGGLWGWVYASRQPRRFEIIPERLAHAEARCAIYNGDIHRGSFAVPTYIRRALAAKERP